MKAIRSIYSVLTAILLCAAAVVNATNDSPPVRDIAIGDPMEAVIARMGPPKGYIRTRTVEVLFYDRGKVEIRDGLVASSELLTPEAAEAKRTREAEERLAREEANRIREEARRLEGLSVKDRKLSDPVFMSLPAGEQIEYWRQFTHRYPGVPIDAEYSEALAQKHRQQQIEQELQGLRRQVRDMEERVAQAEARARRAEDDARQARGRYLYPSTFYGLHYPGNSSHRRTTLSWPTVRLSCR